MAIKLYKFDVPRRDLVQPKEYDGSMSPPKWWPGQYASLDTKFADLMVKLNRDVKFEKGDADTVKAVKAALKSDTDNQKKRRIRAKYTLDDELQALRTNNKTVKDDIASIVAAVESERDALLDVS